MSRALDVGFLLLLSAGLAGAAADRAERRTLDHPAEFQGYTCAASYAWFYADGRLERCTLSAELAIGEAHVPAGSIIVLDASGGLKYVQLVRDTKLSGVVCRGGGALGTAEGSTTLLYADGRPELCWLAGDQVVQGVPCKDAGGFLATLLRYGGEGARFHPTGKLKSCKLSRDFDGLHKGEIYQSRP